MAATIYTAYHRWAPLLSGVQVTPIHVGRARAPAPLAGMIGDDTGPSISDRNPAFCELTALYWAWKNDHDSDMIGLMHYRRLLDLTQSTPTGPVEARPPQLHIPDWLQQTEDWLTHEAPAWDIVVPRAHVMGRTLEANYRAGHQGQDFDLTRKIITRDHPAYCQSFEAVARGHQVRLGNMALMARPVFERYCAWLFDILFKVEAADLPRVHYSPYQRRYLGFLAERLLTVFVHHEVQTNPALRLREVSILNLGQSLVSPSLPPREQLAPESVNIAFSADRAYLPHTAAMLRSMLDFADPERPLNLFFLHNGIDPHDMALLQEGLGGQANAVLHPVHTGPAFEGSYRSSSRAPSNTTYNRFLLFDLLPGLDRLIYLDVDVILRTDICALYDTDIGAARIAAVPDWIMTRTLTGPVRTADPDVPDLAIYHREVLGLSEAEIARYFNAGVLLFNFAAMKEPQKLGQDLVREAREGRYLFRDQDILNMAFKDSLHQLDPRWNVFNSDAQAYDRVPAPGHAQAMAAKADPWIIHYADRAYKPWQYAAVPMAQHYWQALIRTPFYGEVVGGRGPQPPAGRRSGIVGAGRALAERFPALKRPLLRLYAGLNGQKR